MYCEFLDVKCLCSSRALATASNSLGLKAENPAPAYEDELDKCIKNTDERDTRGLRFNLVNRKKRKEQI